MLFVSLMAQGVFSHTGAGFYNHTKGERLSFPLGTLSSVFQAEIYAILQCAKSDDLRQRHNDSIAICTDSQAALKALSCPKINSALVVLETMSALRELAIFNSVRLLWVPGHSGIPGNEIADGLARQASAQSCLGPEPVLSITSTTVRNAMKQWAVWEQYTLWNSTVGCRQAKSMLKGIDLSLSKYALRLTRGDLRILTGLLTRHADLNRHLTLIKVRSDPNCPLCQEEEETVLHLLGRCNALSLTRLNHLGSHRMDYNDLSNIRWPLLLKLAKASGRFL